MKHHPGGRGNLTRASKPRGPWQPVSFTGAVSSQSVTEGRDGRLSLVGNQAYERMGRSRLDCETHGSSSCESRPK